MRARMIREDVSPGELRRLAKFGDDRPVARRLLALAAAELFVGDGWMSIELGDLVVEGAVALLEGSDMVLNGRRHREESSQSY